MNSTKWIPEQEFVAVTSNEVHGDISITPLVKQWAKVEAIVEINPQTDQDYEAAEKAWLDTEKETILRIVASYKACQMLTLPNNTMLFPMIALAAGMLDDYASKLVREFPHQSSADLEDMVRESALVTIAARQLKMLLPEESNTLGKHVTRHDRPHPKGDAAAEIRERLQRAEDEL